MTKNHSRLSLLILTGVLALSSACASFNPTPIDQVGFQDRALTQTNNGITVTVSVLSADETKATFDTHLYKKKIQPIWVEITNGTDELFGFLPRSVDPSYHSALEVAQKSFKSGAKKSNQAKREFYHLNTMPFELPPGQTRSGFVFGDRSKGVRWMALTIIGENTAETFEFVVEVPGFNADFHKLGDVVIYAEDDYTDLDEDQLVEWIEKQPAFVTNKDGSKTGDPLNLIIIGEADAVWPAFLRMGWDPTEAMTTGSALKTGVFGVFGGGYKYAPISDLYVYGRAQDIALQKVRNNIHYRNHLRLWEAPVKYQGKSVLIGQISRDIGSRFTTKSPTLTTHRIDPDVDETRGSLIQDFLWAQALAVFGYAGGVGKISIEEPRGNLTGDIFFTDGKRAVMLLSAEPVDYEHIARFKWHRPLTKDSVVKDAAAVDEE
jgi:hypothetical protein